MKLAIRNNQDFWTGVMFFVVGTGAVFIARRYPFGTTLRMGPGYFPTVIGAILVAFGLYFMVKGLGKYKEIPENWSIRALFIIPVSIVIFGFLMEVVGFVPALIALIFLSSVSVRTAKFKEVFLLTVFLVVFSVGIFIWGLGLTYPLIHKFW